ncbi:ATP-dependent metallopeptidase FtsH/Yme1/Tma family protein [Lysinibacillus yapensis]|uniref:ATP-dependent zinc metalloprotease FtsH n=1 Tax=Ureibacillus yapensis TaxID=2304605 RepID=A0A396S2T2_9BACL|nr:ATP-dependent zinc metalloprotease FtsH [Lysinibacillus yapensis]RHW31730.1 ATP-dependent metallopeptidase FtsH/Yme1/Tma family protein [Lysinibacillus yapensis]
MNRIFRYTIFYLLIFLVIIGIFGTFNGGKAPSKELTYGDFLNALETGQIEYANIQPDAGVLVVEGALEGYAEGETFTVNLPQDNQALMTQINAAVDNNPEINWLKAPETSGWVQFFTGIIPFIIIIILFFFLLSQSQGGGNKVMNFGKSKAKLYDSEKKKVRFNDVAGADEEKAELVEVVDFLKDHRKFTDMGARIPKGILLVGPPGTGKTLLARAVAGEAGVPFFSISGSDFVEMFVGVGASRVRDLFENAKKNAPCIIFIDEIDAVGRQRGAGLGGGHDEREQTLNQLLVEMDGFGANEGIIIIAATNRPDILDKALLRPGRFDRQITVGYPDVKGRTAILKVHGRNKPLSEDVDFEAVAQRTPGFSGADLENLLNEAALVATRKGKKTIDMLDIDEASDRVIAGPAKTSRAYTAKEKKLVAYHEAGHVVIGLALDSAEKVHKVTIVPRGQAGGYAIMLPKEERFFSTTNELLDRIAGLLGGRASEEIVLGEVSTGAHNDFQKVTNIARKMVTEFGMSKLGQLQFGSSSGGNVFLGRDFNSEQNYSEAIAYEIDKEMQTIVNAQYERTKKILTEKRDLLDLIANTLLEHETLNAEQIEHLRDFGKLPEVKEEPEVLKVNDAQHSEDAKNEPNNISIEKSGSSSINQEVSGESKSPTAEDLPREDRDSNDESNGFREGKGK